MEALAIEAAVNLNVKLVCDILQAINNVRQFRPQCLELKDIVELLLEIIKGQHPIENNDSYIAGSSLVAKSSAFNEEKTWERLKEILEETLAFITKCIGEWNILQQGWEVIVTRKLPRLKQKIYDWMNLCTLVTSASTNNEQRKQYISISQNLQKLHTRADSNAEQMNNMQRIVQLQRQGQDEEAVNIKFPEGDPRLQQISHLGKSRDLLAFLKDVGHVICKEIKNDEIRRGRGSRHVEIYQLISTNELVEVFYGIAELGGKRYAVMEDLRNGPTLAEMIESKAELSGSLHVTRLHLAYEVASAVAYLHSVDIVVKNISDVNIVLKRLSHDSEDGRRFRPCLTNLEKARRIVESTSLVPYDVRFASPEYASGKHKKHSRNSDVWSLGVVIWECTFGGFPFSTAPADIASKKGKSDIQEKLASGMLPWTVEADSADKQGWDDVFTIVDSCWNSRPTLRPPASYVALTLLDFYAQRSLDATSSIYKVPGEVQDSIFEKIRSKRKRATVTNISDEDALRLKRSVDEDKDPRNSFLLGAAVWYELVRVEVFADSFSDGRLGLEYNNLGHDPLVKRARVALSYLENSVDEASKEIGLAHLSLARHFLPDEDDE